MESMECRVRPVNNWRVGAIHSDLFALRTVHVQLKSFSAWWFVPSDRSFFVSAVLNRSDPSTSFDRSLIDLRTNRLIQSLPPNDSINQSIDQ